MELILDTANVEAIKYYQQVLTIDGVTTNPTILARENRDYHEVIKEIMDMANSLFTKIWLGMRPVIMACPW